MKLIHGSIYSHTVLLSFIIGEKYSFILSERHRLYCYEGKIFVSNDIDIYVLSTANYIKLSLTNLTF